MQKNKSQDYENHLHAEEARWFAIYTRYKREKLVATRLTNMGVECYLPLQSVTRCYTRKKKVVELPLINCHLFVKITKASYIKILQTTDVVRFVKVGMNLLAIPQHEIDLLKRIVGHAEDVVVSESDFQAGDKVEVIGGQLTGLTGTLVTTRQKNNFLVRLDTIGLNLEMYIDKKLLRCIQRAPVGPT